MHQEAQHSPCDALLRRGGVGYGLRLLRPWTGLVRCQAPESTTEVLSWR